MKNVNKELEKIEKVKKILKENQFVLSFLPDKDNQVRRENTQIFYTVLCNSAITGSSLISDLVKINSYLNENTWEKNKKELENNFEITKNDTEKNDICVFCGKEINKNIQPWNYYFPSKVFHLGCGRVAAGKGEFKDEKGEYFIMDNGEKCYY